MRDAVADDFRRLPGVEVVTTDGVHPIVEPLHVKEHAGRCDWSLVVAPEFGDTLAKTAGLIVECGGRLLGPSPLGIRLAADKLALSDVWQANGVPTPAAAPAGAVSERYPQVLKPRDGVGSEFTFRCDSAAERNHYLSVLRENYCYRDMIVQDFVPGRSASVAFLVSPSQLVALAPTYQCLSSDGRFRYDGGELPIPPALAERAVALGRRAVACAPGLLGYVGVDLVLGDAADGSRDFAIEINPRLTTSYVGLRALADFNLAGAMLRAAAGDPIPPPRWHPDRIRFRSDGTVTRLPPT